MNLPTLTAYLERSFSLQTKAGDMVVYDHTVTPTKRIAIIHRRGDAIVWTIEFANLDGMMDSESAPNLETAVLKFIAGHLERTVIKSQGDLFNKMMEHFIVEPSDDDLSPGVAPERFIARHTQGGEVRYVIFEAGNPNYLAIFDSEEEAEKSPLMGKC